LIQHLRQIAVIFYIPTAYFLHQEIVTQLLIASLREMFSLFISYDYSNGGAVMNSKKFLSILGIAGVAVRVVTGTAALANTNPTPDQLEQIIQSNPTSSEASMAFDILADNRGKAGGDHGKAGDDHGNGHDGEHGKDGLDHGKDGDDHGHYEG
jgi:hypothetical protein